MVKVNINEGTVLGTSDGDIDTFLGIPYAQSFNSKTRFQHSQLYNIVDEMIDAKKAKPIPPQPYNSLEDFFSNGVQTFETFKQDENCLYLNIWRASNTQNLKPVVIYFYGGGFTQGHGTADLYNPYHLVEQEDTIVITFNYRLGALGYLDWSYFNNHYDYNNGMSDQINLLKWVHHHIAYFGGNPQNITLMGQSAGSMSIMALMQIPELDQYYHKVMLLSGTLHSDSPLTANKKAQQFESLVHKHYPDKSIESLTSNEILDLMRLHKVERGPSRSLDLIYQPIQSPEMTRSVTAFSKPVFVGFTNSEGDIYIENDSRKLSPLRFKEIMRLFDIPILEEVQSAQQQREVITTSYFKNMALNFLQSTHSQHKWLARFDWCKPKSIHFKSAYHILDMIFWFGNLNILSANNYHYTQSDIQLSHDMMADLGHFVRYNRMPWSKYHENTEYFHIYK
ncbi:carboxylesterase family protein [Staphylococcus capitis subsp. urealyticus]|uniref:carboxylesterase family protein n=1 Tax=Staphylococcus capitis TaxID=29388 RepID=UPI0034587161